MSGLAAALREAQPVGSGVKLQKIDRLIGDDTEVARLIVERAPVIGVSAIARILTAQCGEKVGPKAVTAWLERQSH